MTTSTSARAAIVGYQYEASCDTCGWTFRPLLGGDRLVQARARRHRCESDWTFIESEDDLFTVGRFEWGVDWVPRSDHGTQDDAEAEIAKLRGRS